MASIYRGIAFPFSKKNKELPASAVDADLIEDSLIQIVMTSRGERVMRPIFGSTALSFVFENNDTIRAEMLKADLLKSISLWEPRVAIRMITFGIKDTTLLINILYVIIALQEERKLTLGLPMSS